MTGPTDEQGCQHGGVAITGVAAADTRGAPARADDGPVPADAAALHAWLLTNAGVRVPTRAVVAGSRPPFDYLVHSFFEGRTSWHGTGAPGPADCVVWAGRGGGKTFLGAVATVLDMVFKPGIEIRILGGSMEQSRRMHAHLRKLFKAPALASMVEGEITERRVRLKNGSEVELLAQSQVSVRGTRVQKLRCDEVELFDAHVWEAAQLVTRSRTIHTGRHGTIEVRGAVECFSTMHAPHGLMRKLVDECASGRRALFRWGVLDVLERCPSERRCRVDSDDARPELEDVRPGDCILVRECGGRAHERTGADSGHVTIDDAVVLKRRVSLATWEAEMLSLRPRRTDAVLPEFDPGVHVVREAPGAGAGVVRWVAGMDFGFRAPTVVLWAAVDTGNVLWVVDERVESGVLLAEHARAIVAAPWPRVEWVGVDPAGMQTDGQTGVRDVEVLRRAGLRVKLRRLGVTEGLGLVRARLRPAAGDEGPRLYVHERCAKLIESLGMYHYNAARPESTEPVKDGPDHAVDALRYMVQNLDRPLRVAAGNYAE